MCVCVFFFSSRDKIVCLPRVSVCELEADAVAGDILNRHELSLGEFMQLLPPLLESSEDAVLVTK